MGEVLDITSKLPRSADEPKKFAAHFVDLGFLRRAAQSNIWGWAAQNGDVQTPMPPDLAARVAALVSRHVAGVGKILIDQDNDNWAICFTATSVKGGTYTYTFEVDLEWGTA